MARRLIAYLIPILILMVSSPAIFSQDEDLPPMPPGVPGSSDQSEVEEDLPPPAPPGPAEEPNSPGPTLPPDLSEPGPIVPLPPMEIISPVDTGTGRDWPMFKGDASRTGYTDEHLDFPLKLAWRFSADLPQDEMGKQNPSSPAVMDGVVYFCAGRRLYAVNAETGSLRWVYPAEGSLTATIKSSPLVGEDLVYFGGGDGRLYAVTKDRGTLAWNFVTKGVMNSSPVLADDMVYVGSGDNFLYALDARTGQLRWPSGFRTNDDIQGSPAVSDGLVYFLSGDMLLFATHAATGAIKWYDRVAAVAGGTTPVVSANTVYTALGNLMQARQAKSGRLSWNAQLSSTITSIPSVAHGIVYFGCKNGKLYALTNAGKLKWDAPADLGAPVHGSPIIVGDTVVAGGNRGVLAAVDAETGQLKWKYVIQPSWSDYGRLRYVNVSSTPVVSDGTLYVLADDGTLHAFRQDMPDSTPPQVSAVVPARNSIMPGAPPIQIAAEISDPGSGINYDSIAMLLDGEPVEHVLIPERGIVWYKTPVTQPVEPLKDGRHTVTLSVTDWVGNRAETRWYFRVDNRIRRAPTSQQGTGTGAPGLPSSGTGRRN